MLEYCSAAPLRAMSVDELAGDQLDLVADGLAHPRRAGRPLARDEGVVGAVLAHVLGHDRQRAVDEVAVLRRVAPHVEEHQAQRAEALVDQREPEQLEGAEVAVERGRHDPDLLGHLAQRDRREVGVGGQGEGGVEDGAPGALLALGARRPVAGARRSARHGCRS